MYGLIGNMKAYPGQRETLTKLLLKSANDLREMVGCYLYVISNATDDPERTIRFRPGALTGRGGRFSRGA